MVHLSPLVFTESWATPLLCRNGYGERLSAPFWDMKISR